MLNDGGSPGIEEWVIESVRDRRRRQLQLILSLSLPGDAAILDVGGRSYYDFFKQHTMHYEMIDIDEDVKLGKGGGYNKHPKGSTFDGKQLPYAASSFDLIILSYCLHHASQYSIGLLEQATYISRKYILIAEDLTGIDYPKKWLDRNHMHEPGGMFRSQVEWERLFELLGCVIKSRIAIRRKDDIDKERFYRMNWILLV